MNIHPEAEPRPTVSLTRILDAPLALVWTVWTDPVHVKQWFGPHGFTVPLYEADVRAGGKVRYQMRAPDGTIFPSEGTFEEVVVRERIVTVGEVEIAGSIAFEARTTITFAEHDGKTTVTVLQTYSKVSPGAADALAGAPLGWSQQFERLDAYLLATGGKS